MFNRSLDGLNLPKLHSLMFGNSFNQNLEHVAQRLINLQCLSYLGGFNYVLAGGLEYVLSFHILGITISTEKYFSDAVKPPISVSYLLFDGAPLIVFLVQFGGSLMVSIDQQFLCTQIYMSRWSTWACFTIAFNHPSWTIHLADRK